MNLQNYTKAELQNAREYAASITERALVSTINCSCKPVTQDYIDKINSQIVNIKAGLDDGNFTIYQRMEYYLTGTTTSLLP